MAILHCDSAGSNTSPYETWAKAATSFATVCSAAVDGDTIYLDDGFDDRSNVTVNTTFNGPGADQALTIISVDKASETDGDTSNYSQGAIIGSSTSGVHITLNDANFIFWGVNFYVTGSGGQFRVANYEHLTVNDATIQNQGPAFNTNGVTGSAYWFNNIVHKPVGTAQSGLIDQNSAVSVRVMGYSGDGTNDNPQYILKPLGDIAVLDVRAADTSIFESFGGIVMAVGVTDGVFSNISGGRYGTSQPMTNGSTFNSQVGRAWGFCAGENGIYDIDIEDAFGTTIDNTSVYIDAEYNTSGSKYSLETTPRTKGRLSRGHEFVLFHRWVASNSTFTFEFTYDQAATTLTNADLYLVMEYPDATNPQLSKVVTTMPSDPHKGATTLTTSTASWTGTGAWSNQVKYKIAITATSGGAGMHRISMVYCPDATTPVLYTSPLPAIT